MVFVNLCFRGWMMPKFKNWAERTAHTAGRYVWLVQGRNHARRARVAMFWSAASLFYVLGDLEVKTVLHLPFIGGFSTVNPEVFLFFLLTMATYYFVRFLFSVLKINAEVKLRSFRAGLLSYHAHRKLEAMKIVSPRWWHNISRCRYQRRKNRADIAIHGDFETLRKWVNDLGPASATAKKHFPGLEIQSADNARDMLEYPVFSALENGFARIFLPALLYTAAFSALVWKLSSEIGQPLVACVSILFTVFLADTIDEFIL